MGRSSCGGYIAAPPRSRIRGAPPETPAPPVCRPGRRPRDCGRVRECRRSARCGTGARAARGRRRRRRACRRRSAPGSRFSARSAGSSALRAPRTQAASARRSLRVDSAKPRKILSIEFSMSSIRSASIASARPPGRPASCDEILADAAQNERAHPLGLRERQDRRDARAERIAHDVGAGDGEMVDEIGDVAGHQVERILRGIIELLRTGHARDCRGRRRGGRLRSGS